MQRRASKSTKSLSYPFLRSHYATGRGTEAGRVSVLVSFFLAGFEHWSASHSLCATYIFKSKPLTLRMKARIDTTPENRQRR